MAAPKANPTERSNPRGGGEQPPPERRDPWRVEGAPPPPKEPPQPHGFGPFVRRWWWVIAAALLLNYLAMTTIATQTPQVTVPYSTFTKELADGNVKSIDTTTNTITGEFKSAVKWPPSGSSTTSTIFKTERPTWATDQLTQEAQAQGVPVTATKPAGTSALVQFLLFFGPALLIIGLFWLIMRRAAGGAGGPLGSFGRSRAKRYEQGAQRTTFADVAGIDDAEGELEEIVDFLKNPDKYRRLGGAIPSGVLLAGLPGTGKTLLARAVAGEADVPFFSMSASEFIEMIVGVGASRVRDLFQQAKAAAPAIIFIDELDAIGRARGSASGLGGHDEREQTLNQILTEMDGFDGSEGVIVIGATNRPEILDPALLRPGRFDRRVVVSPPDQPGRRKILEVHTRGKPLSDAVDLDAIAASTPGMVGADIRNLANEAALTAARRGHESIEPQDFTDALEKVILGTERKIALSHHERELTAYHESGHALLGMLVPGADPVRKVSIVPRGRALGVTLQAPESDRYGYDATYLKGRLVGMLGGRAAEQLVYGNVTTGAESDLEHVTRLAKMMVGRWGMSDRIGLVSVVPGPNDEPLYFPGQPGGVSEETQRIVDEEVRRISEEAYADALRLLSENRPKLDALAHALMHRETLDETAAYEVAGIERKKADEPVHMVIMDEASRRSREHLHVDVTDADAGDAAAEAGAEPQQPAEPAPRPTAPTAAPGD